MNPVFKLPRSNVTGVNIRANMAGEMELIKLVKNNGETEFVLKIKEQMTEKEKELLEKNKELVEKNKKVMEKSEDLVKKNKELAEKNKELVKKNKEVVDKDKELVEKNKEVVEKHKKVMEKNKELVEKNKELVDKDKELVKKNKEVVEKHNKLLAELKAKVECPVCLLLPTKGPMASCPKGHLVCLPCHQTMVTQGLVNCPNCREPTGKTMSLLAKTVIENMEHECTNQDCDEKLSHREVVKHREELCKYRRVLCPGNSRLCKDVLPFWELKDHFTTCMSVAVNNQRNNACTRFIKKSVLGKDSLDAVNGFAGFRTEIFNLNNEVFAVQKRMENGNFSFGVVMLAEREKCTRFKVAIEIQDVDGETAFLAQFSPAAIDLENRDLASLVVPKLRFAQIATSKEDEIKYKLVIKVSEKRGVLQLG